MKPIRMAKDRALRDEGMSPSVEQVDAFMRSRDSRPRWSAVPKELRPTTIVDGYCLQRKVYERLAQQGVRQMGYKIGCTAPESQKPFGLKEPIYAGIFEHTQFSTLREALSAPLVAPSIECEIALRVGTLSGIEAGAMCDEQLLTAIAEIYVACEVVDSRYGDSPPSIGAPTLLVDDYLHAGFVLGAPQACLPGPAFGTLQTEITADGTIFTEPAPETLSPLAALRWLVSKLAENGDRLFEGQIVMTGSLLRPVPVQASSTLTMTVRGLGTLSSQD